MWYWVLISYTIGSSALAFWFTHYDPVEGRLVFSRRRALEWVGLTPFALGILAMDVVNELLRRGKDG